MGDSRSSDDTTPDDSDAQPAPEKVSEGAEEAAPFRREGDERPLPEHPSQGDAVERARQRRTRAWANARRRKLRGAHGAPADDAPPPTIAEFVRRSPDELVQILGDDAVERKAPDVTVSGIFGDSLRAYGAHWLSFTLLIALVELPALLLLLTPLYAPEVFLALTEPVDSLKAKQILFTVEVVSAQAVLRPLAVAMMSYAVLQHLRGAQKSLAESIRLGLRRTLPVLGVAFGAGLLTLAGFVMLIVPGIILLCGLFVAVPVAVVERRGFVASLGRSWELTTGYRGKIFGLLLLLGVISRALAFVAGRIFPAETNVAAFITASYGIVIPIDVLLSVAAVVAYNRLRPELSEVTSAKLASVFD